MQQLNVWPVWKLSSHRPKSTIPVDDALWPSILGTLLFPLSTCMTSLMLWFRSKMTPKPHMLGKWSHYRSTASSSQWGGVIWWRDVGGSEHDWLLLWLSLLPGHHDVSIFPLQFPFATPLLPWKQAALDNWKHEPKQISLLSCGCWVSCSSEIHLHRSPAQFSLALPGSKFSF